MKKTIFAVVAIGFALSASAQTAPREAQKVAELMTKNTWYAMEMGLPDLTNGMESQLLSMGVDDKSAKTFAEELGRAMNQENISKVVAQLLSEKFNDEELKQLKQFLQSDVGLKYQQLAKDIAGDVKIMTPIFKQACNSANQRLNSSPRAKLVGFCSQF